MVADKIEKNRSGGRKDTQKKESGERSEPVPFLLPDCSCCNKEGTGKIESAQGIFDPQYQPGGDPEDQGLAVGRQVCFPLDTDPRSKRIGDEGKGKLFCAVTGRKGDRGIGEKQKTGNEKDRRTLTALQHQTPSNPGIGEACGDFKEPYAEKG